MMWMKYGTLNKTNTKSCAYRFLAVSFLLFISAFVVHAGEASRSILDAHKIALKIYKENKDANSAAVVLEKSDVRGLMEKRPSGMSAGTYISILNDYAFFLAETDDRYGDAIPVLKKVIELSPKREVAYLNLGDAYLKEFKKSNSEASRETAKQNYQRYAELLKEKGKNNRLPERVAELLWGNGYDTATGKNPLRIGDEKVSTKADIAKKDNIEWLQFSSNDYQKERNMIIAKYHISKSDVKNGHIYIALTDLNNDGKNEIFAYIDIFEYCGQKLGCPLGIYGINNSKIHSLLSDTLDIGYPVSLKIDNNGNQKSIGITSTVGNTWKNIFFDNDILKWNGKYYDW